MLVKGKKGDVNDIITFVIIVFFIATAMLVAAFVNNEMREIVLDDTLGNTTVAQKAADQMQTITQHSVQNGTVAIVAFLVIGMMLSSFMVRIHPVFLFMYIIFLLAAIFTAIPLANSYQMLMNAGPIAAVSAQQPMINWLMQHLLKIVLGVGALSMIVTFAKLKGQGGGSDI